MERLLGLMEDEVLRDLVAPLMMMPVALCIIYY